MARPNVPAARPGTNDVIEPRDGLNVEAIEAGCCVVVGSAMLRYLQNQKIEIRPFSPQREPARASPIDHCRHWRRSAMVQRASVSARDEGGGYEAMSCHCDFGNIGRSLLWLSFALASTRGQSVDQSETNASTCRDPDL